MGSYVSYLDLVQATLDRMGESQTDTAGDFYASVQREVVRAHREICRAHPFLFLRSNPPGALVTVASYTTGTITVTKGATAATLSAAPAAGLGSFKGRKLVVSGWAEYYRITAHTAGAVALTLDAAYQGTTVAGQAYTIYEDEYDLAADVRYIVGMYTADAGLKIEQRSEDWIRAEYPEPTGGAWPPKYFCRIGEVRIRFSQYPTLDRRIEYPYTVMAADIDGVGVAIPIPQDARQLVADGAAYFGYLLKNDNRADGSALLFKSSLEQLILEDGRKRLALGGQWTGTGPYGP